MQKHIELLEIVSKNFRSFISHVDLKFKDNNSEFILTKIIMELK